MIKTACDVVVTRQVTTVVQKVVQRSSGQPPRFVRPIQPCVVREGDSCEFTAAVSGVPVPEIAWLKDKVDLVLVPGRHQASFNPDTGECSLVIQRAEPGDVGVYSCRATNVAGRATCTANVVVVRKLSALSLRPRFDFDSTSNDSRTTVESKPNRNRFVVVTTVVLRH